MMMFCVFCDCGLITNFFICLICIGLLGFLLLCGLFTWLTLSCWLLLAGLGLVFGLDGLGLYFCELLAFVVFV